jgi:nicotinate phosphoribosyltransferase
MQQAVLELYPEAQAEYIWFNRRTSDGFTPNFVAQLKGKIYAMGDLELLASEYEFMRTMPWFKPTYLEYLTNYRFNPKEVELSLVDDQLDIRIKGPWHRTILWEVPLMAMISELYFTQNADKWSYDQQMVNACAKGEVLLEAGCHYTDFGTRRRRTHQTQNIVLQAMKDTFEDLQIVNSKFDPPDDPPYDGKFIGTSNVYFAKLFGLTAVGTYAHEWVQAHSILGSLVHANRDAMEAWVKVYHSELGIALTDTYGTDAFLRDFTGYYARLFDGVRHDSGCPFKFTDKIVEHYKKLRIDPQSKTIIFSDSLDVQKACELQEHCKDKIKCAFGIGTNFTNDFEGKLKALNMVIKLVKVNGFPVVKLSDDPRKSIGDRDAVRVARYANMGIPLDMPLDCWKEQ